MKKLISKLEAPEASPNIRTFLALFLRNKMPKKEVKTAKSYFLKATRGIL